MTQENNQLLIEAHPEKWRADLYEVIFEAETPKGKAFDVVLLWAILISIFVVMMESVTAFRTRHGELLRNLEWFFTFIFTIEYIFRLVCIKKIRNYTFSFFGMIDFLAIIPTYFSLFFIGAQSLMVIRTLRLLRVFRVLKLGRYLKEFDVLIQAVKTSKDKIFVFLMMILSLTVIMGTVMYLVEGEASGFTSIPKSIYWSIVTITTVGYGDIAPKTIVGQIVSSMIMIMGYAMIIVPTGIFSVEMSEALRGGKGLRVCAQCKTRGHAPAAVYCHQCGEKL